MSTPLEDFAAAHKAYADARRRITEIATIIRGASVKLECPGKVQVSNIEGRDGYIRPPVADYCIDANTWPTADDLHAAFVALQRTHSAILSAYGAIPEDARSAVQRPESI